MNKTLFGIGVTMAGVALAASLVTAQGGRGAGRGGNGQQFGRGPEMRGGHVGPQGRGGRSGGAFGFALAGLGLTEEQRAKVIELQRSAREGVAPLEAELRGAERALHGELFADSRDAAKIASLSAQVGKLRGQLAEARLTTTAAVSDLLTAEQRAAVRERPGRLGGRGPGRAGGVGHGDIRRR